MKFFNFALKHSKIDEQDIYKVDLEALSQPDLWRGDDEKSHQRKEFFRILKIL